MAVLEDGNRHTLGWRWCYLPVIDSEVGASTAYRWLALKLEVGGGQVRGNRVPSGGSMIWGPKVMDWCSVSQSLEVVHLEDEVALNIVYAVTSYMMSGVVDDGIQPQLSSCRDGVTASQGRSAKLFSITGFSSLALISGNLVSLYNSHILYYRSFKQFYLSLTVLNCFSPIFPWAWVRVRLEENYSSRYFHHSRH